MHSLPTTKGRTLHLGSRRSYVAAATGVMLTAAALTGGALRHSSEQGSHGPSLSQAVASTTIRASSPANVERPALYIATSPDQAEALQQVGVPPASRIVVSQSAEESRLAEDAVVRENVWREANGLPPVDVVQLQK